MVLLLPGSQDAALSAAALQLCVGLSAAFAPWRAGSPPPTDTFDALESSLAQTATQAAACALYVSVAIAVHFAVAALPAPAPGRAIGYCRREKAPATVTQCKEQKTPC